MAQFSDTNTKTFEADEALLEFTRVKMDADGKITYADAADPFDGVVLSEAFAAGDMVAVKLRTGCGTHKMLAAGAITAGDTVFGAADGKIAATAGGEVIGKALEAASGAGSIIEVMISPQPLNVATLAAAGSSQTDAAQIATRVVNVTGNDATKGVKLPAGAAGIECIVYAAAATNALKLYPATDGTINGGSANASVSLEGKTVAICYCVDGTNWAVSYTADS